MEVPLLELAMQESVRLAQNSRVLKARVYAEIKFGL